MIDKILELKMYSVGLRKTLTIKEFMQKLLIQLFEQGEGFNGKRPFGDSGWEDDIILCLVENNIIEGVIEDGQLEDYDYSAYEFIIKRCINSL